MISLRNITEAYRNATPEEKREFLELILPDVKILVHNELDSSLDEKLLDIDYDLCKLEEKIENVALRPVSTEPIQEEEHPFIPETQTEKTFVEFINFISTKVKNGIRAITPKILHNEFRLKYLSQDLRPETVNHRQWKKEFFEFVEKMIQGLQFVKLGNNRGIRMLIPATVDIEALKRKFCVS